jgi:hypothetical protein
MLLNAPQISDSIQVLLNSHVKIKIRSDLNREYALINGITEYGLQKILLPKKLKLKIIDINDFMTFKVLEDHHNFKIGNQFKISLSELNGCLNFDYIRD